MRFFIKSYLRNILLVSLAICIVLPLYNILVIFPAISKTLIDNTRDDAVRVARHLSSILISESGAINATLSTDALLDEVREPTAEFDLVKLKVFSGAGEVVFSTDPHDVGIVNREPYFSDIVAKGNVHTKVVWKHQKSLEGQTMSSDVVETYVPIMDDGVLRGAFEIYYDITDKKEELDRLLSRSTGIILALATGLIAVILVTMTKESKSIAERESAEEMIRYLAHHDGLTSLPNRFLYREHVNRALVAAQRAGGKLAVLFVDLDNFKAVNDTVGHGMGDVVLQQVAARFGKTLRKSDVLARQGDDNVSPSIARFGGDEFTVLLSDIDGEHDAAQAAGRLLEALAEPFVVGNRQFDIGASIGISLYPQDGEDYETLTANADAAMYREKADGTRSYQFYSR